VVKPLTMTISVEETFFGKIYRMLDTMPGVASIAIHSEGVKANGAARPKKKQGGTQSAHCLVLGALVKSPGITKAQLVPVCGQGLGQGRDVHHHSSGQEALRHSLRNRTGGRVNGTSESTPHLSFHR
jgi:hypothetical protein